MTEPVMTGTPTVLSSYREPDCDVLNTWSLIVILTESVIVVCST